ERRRPAGRAGVRRRHRVPRHERRRRGAPPRLRLVLRRAGRRPGRNEPGPDRPVRRRGLVVPAGRAGRVLPLHGRPADRRTGGPAGLVGGRAGGGAGRPAPGRPGRPAAAGHGRRARRHAGHPRSPAAGADRRAGGRPAGAPRAGPVPGRAGAALPPVAGAAGGPGPTVDAGVRGGV
ncbi:MAG: hypothetical protein AVDCRST_MAG41-696, partial [uncultured Corynebacteriales bacterium]